MLLTPPVDFLSLKSPNSIHHAPDRPATSRKADATRLCEELRVRLGLTTLHTASVMSTYLPDPVRLDPPLLRSMSLSQYGLYHALFSLPLLSVHVIFCRPERAGGYVTTVSRSAVM